jgi:hypothetical protein
VNGELVADLRQPVPHWAVIVEQSTSRSRPDSLLRTDHRINTSDWPDGGQVGAARTLGSRPPALLRNNPLDSASPAAGDRIWGPGYRAHASEHMSHSCVMQVWELMGKYLVNQTFAAEWGFPLDRGPDDIIPNDLSDPNLQDGWLPPVSCCPVASSWSPWSPWSLRATSGQGGNV